MEPIFTFLIYMAVLLVISMAGAYVPFIRKLSDNQIHLLIALSTGIFLGILFLMLLPEALHETLEETINLENDAMKLCICILAGFLTILLVDILIKHFHMRGCPCECHEDEHRHNITSLSAFIGLSVHACVDGLTLAAALLAGEEVGLMALIGMGIHKFVVLFSLSSTFLLTDLKKKDILKYLFAFALITPVAGLVSFLVLNGMSVEGMTGLPLAFASGTFLYVTFCNMIPEAFHRKNQDLKSFTYVVIGLVICIVAVVLINMLGGHVH